jgi:hypothetical protein
VPARGLEIARRLTPARLRAEARTSGFARAAARMSTIANALEMPERKEAARLAGLSGQALRDAILRYNAEGLDGLYDRPRSGRARTPICSPLSSSSLGRLTPCGLARDMQTWITRASPAREW